MRFKLTFPVALTIGLFLTGIARPVEAQETAFVAALKELAAARDGVAAARDQMTAALVEWDRQLARLQAQVETADGLSEARAFQLRGELGLLYRRRGRLDDALRQFDAAAALQPRATDVQLLRALTLEAAGRLDDAGRAYEAEWGHELTNPVKAYLVLRRAPHIEAGVRTRAHDVLREAYGRILSGRYLPPTPTFITADVVPDASSRTPIAGDGRLDRVFAHVAAGRLDDAVAALRTDGPPASRGDAASARIVRAGAAEREGRLADARREYALALEGTLAGRYALHVGIARLAQVEGDSDAAIDAFEHAVRLSPNDPVLRRELAAALVAAGRFDDAFTELVAALLITPNDADVLAAMGQTFVDSDRPEEAIAPLRRALAVNAARYQTHYALAVALSRAGHTDEAAREFELFDRLSRQAMEGRRRVMAGQAGDGAQR